MTLAPGTRLGPYEVSAQIGVGGMGEVYRATDTNLKRAVAIKVLPASVAADAERLARFQREAEVLAALNHPNIAAIYGLERSGATTALVMELVEGPTLADRIAQGPIPLDEALPIAKQIAEALEAAHEQGIVHRDLKPANIKVRQDGTVKVLDFGLAKAMEPASGSSPSMSMSPTITTPAMTQAGMILGTAAYMSPEQAKGRTVDRRADVWAFGAVVFEMLTGTRAFEGDGVSETLARVIEREPAWNRLPAKLSPALRTYLERCLQKDPRQRIRDIGDVRLALEGAFETTAPLTTSSAPSSTAGGRLVWMAAFAVAAALAAALAVPAVRHLRETPPPSLPEMRVEVTTPPTTDQVSLAISPDGQQLAFVASSDGRSKLWLRSLATGSARAFPGTDGASFPFWSPDSRSIGFFANDKLNRIDIDGGSLRALANAPVGAGGTWSQEGVILYPTVPDAPIMRVSAAGGAAALVPGAKQGQPGERFPQFLPDGRHFLYYVAEATPRGVYVGTLDGPERRRLFDADAAAVFVPPAQVLFLRAGTLFAQRFDPVRLQLEGNAVPLAEGVNVDAVGVAAVSASTVGSIVYRLGSANRQRQLLWFDRSGKPIGIAGAPDSATPMNPVLSPDGRRVALSRSVNGNADIWLLELGRNVFSRFTSDPRPDIYPVWSPDGRRIAYASSNRQGPGFNLFQKPAAGAGSESSLLEISQNMIPLDWSRDGRFLLYVTSDQVGGWDIGALPMDGSLKPFLVAQAGADERAGQFSPSGQWIAFESNESGRDEIYVQPFPGPATKTIVSTTGGLQPRWAPDGKELFYIAPDGHLISVSLRFPADGQTIEPASPVPLFATRVENTRTGGTRQNYVVSPDGQRFLMNTLTEQAGSPIILVLNRAPLEH